MTQRLLFHRLSSSQPRSQLSVAPQLASYFSFFSLITPHATYKTAPKPILSVSSALSRHPLQEQRFHSWHVLFSSCLIRCLDTDILFHMTQTQTSLSSHSCTWTYAAFLFSRFQDLELFFAVITACRTACFALRPNSVRPRSQLCAAPQLASYFSIFFLFMSHAPYSPVEVRQCGSVRWAVELAVEVRQCWQCPLSSGARGWGPAAHWHLELAVAVRQCPLSSGACVWGPAVPSAIWSSRLRCGRAHWDPELALEVRQCPLRSSIRSWDAKLPEEKKEKHLWWNLEILTWQAGKYIILH